MAVSRCFFDPDVGGIPRRCPASRREPRGAGCCRKGTLPDLPMILSELETAVSASSDAAFVGSYLDELRVSWQAVLRHCSLLPFSQPLPPFPMRRALPGSEYYGGSAPPGRSAVGAPIPASGPDARRREPGPGDSRVHRDPLSGLGARLCPSSIATRTPQAFPVASRCGFRIPPGSSRRPYGRRCALRPAPIRRVRAGGPGEGCKAPVPRVLLSATLARPATSGSTRTSRLCQGCPRPPRHHADQAALSYSGLLRQATGEGLSPPHGQQRLTAQTETVPEPEI